MEEPKLYNSRVISTYIEYIRKAYPNIIISELYEKSGITPYELADEGHWLTQAQTDRFHEILTEMTGDPEISRNAGRFIVDSRAFQSIRQFGFRFITPVQVFNMLGKIMPYLSRASSYHARKIGRNKVEIISKPNPGATDRIYQCQNRMGSMEAIVLLFTSSQPVLEHPICYHNGGEHCQYIVSWEEPKHLKWRRIRNYALLAAIPLIIIGYFTLPSVLIAELVLPLMAIVMGASLYSNHLEKLDAFAKLEKQGDAASRLLDQITISYNNALLVQEIGQAVSSILDINTLLQYVMDTLQKRLNFDRGMIMLADPDKAKLNYVSGYGYSTEKENDLRKVEFHLDNPLSRGPFILAFKEQKPLLIDSIETIKDELTPRSRLLMEMLDVKSFICVPIVYEGKSEGVLAVDNDRSNRPLNQSEVNLLMGIAPQIAISINNAKSIHQIMESEERFRTLSENSPDIIYTTDNKGFITYINPTAEEILGYTRDEMSGRPFMAFAIPEERSTISRLFGRVAQDQDIITNFEAKFLAKDGAERVFFMSSAPNFNAHGEIMGAVGTLKDFTEQRKLENELHHASRMTALGRLTGGISHDFNNILQAINSYNQLLTMQKTEADPDWRYLMNIQSLTKRATDLVNQLLIFSRKVESRMAPTSVNDEIRNFYELLVNTLPKTITLKLDLEEHLPLLNGDAGQLGQVIMNLTINAKDAMPGGGELKFVTKSVEFTEPNYRDKMRINPGRYILLQISDTGSGIDNEDLNHIFDPFFTTKAEGKGTGIGLSVVYGIIKNHDGYIFCTSERGQGTTFEIFLPVMNVTMPEETVAMDRKPGLVRGQETILLVDDEPSLLETGRELLSLLGYHVLTANSAERALEIIAEEREKIGLVILDLMMPGMGGEKCLPEILKIVPSMKVIIASGYTAGIKMEDIIHAGAVAFIQKPYHIEALSKKIREIFDKVDSSV